jgi:signal transduction histidine kinase
MTPPARERTEVLDLCTSEEWPRLVGHIHRDWGEFTVALLWNPGDKEQAITLNFAQAGMNPHRRYAVWSFWDDRYLGVAKESWTTPKLGASASQHLVFTPLDDSPSRPVLIGSDLHIYSGAAEIQRVQTARAAMTIELTDAGARDGALFVYSRYAPVLRSATGCVADGIASAGENVWRISLHDRNSGSPQRIELAVLLPLTGQLWFWLLIASVLVSILFAVWRYIMWQQAQVRMAKLEQQISLDRERSRIARDIHDEIGANLTHISILSTLAAKPTTEPPVARERNAEVASVARQTIQAFDEILWSINPRNDTLQNLSQYICRRAEDILAPANVVCRCEYDDTFPAGVVLPQARHGLLLAVKEALHNIIKHAGAQRVDVSCRMEGPEFVVMVSDDGRGFDETSHPEQARARSGYGLEGLRQRMAELGGTCRVESRPGGGTRVIFRLPAGAA